MSNGEAWGILKAPRFLAWESGAKRRTMDRQTGQPSSLQRRHRFRFQGPIGTEKILTGYVPVLVARHSGQAHSLPQPWDYHLSRTTEGPCNTRVHYQCFCQNTVMPECGDAIHAHAEGAM